MGFPRQEYWSGLPFPSPGDLPPQGWSLHLLHCRRILLSHQGVHVCGGACMLRHFSCVQVFATPWTVPHQAPLSMRFPRQEYWSGLTFPSLGDLSNPGIEPESPALQANALPLSHLGSSSIYHYPHFKYGVSIFDT